jgi:hypothetical protein
VLAQPGALLAPVWAVPLEERPEHAGVIRDPEVAKLVNDHIVDHVRRRQHQPPIEGKRAPRRARAPQGPLSSDPDPPVRDTDTPGLLLGQLRDEPPRSDPPLSLAHVELIEAEARHLAALLLLDPPTPVRKDTIDLCLAHPLRNDKPRRPVPWNLHSPTPRPSRAQDLDSVHSQRD